MADGCNLCGGGRWETLETHGEIRVVRCAGCGLVFLAPQPPRPRLEANYDEPYYRPWGDQAAARERIWRRRLALAAERVPPPARLLDVGCGAGDFLARARARGYQVAGTELSAYGAEATRAAGLSAFQGEIWEAGLPAGSFDLVTCWHVIEHVADPRRVLEEICRLLRPGGWLLLATPNLEDRIFRAAYRLTRGRRPALYEPDERELHLFVFSADSLRRLAERSGFEGVRVGFDRGAAAVWGKRAVDGLAYAWFRLTGLHWGLALEMEARRPGGRP